MLQSGRPSIWTLLDGHARYRYWLNSPAFSLCLLISLKNISTPLAHRVLHRNVRPSSIHITAVAISSRVPQS